MKLAAWCCAVTGVILLTGCQTFGIGSYSDMKVRDLRCEYKSEPLGIDVTSPRLSWTLDSSVRGRGQSAYRILVASSAKNLTADKGDLWDSGKVESNSTNQIVYAGKPLVSRMDCYWKVCVWDEKGRICRWSEPASWTMGLLKESDWKAKWIGYDADPPKSYGASAKADSLNLEGANWVWFNEGDPTKAAPIGTRYFRAKLDIPADRTVSRARFRLIADNEGTLYVNGDLVQKFQGWTPPYELDVTKRLKAGVNVIAISVDNSGDSPNPAGLGGRLQVEFKQGQPLTMTIDKSWKAAESGKAGWNTAAFDDSGWKPVKIVAATGQGPWGALHKPALVLPPPPYFRKAFDLGKPIVKATVYASALGIYELHINGHRVGDDYFTPGWTDYPTRVYYQTYDVTPLVKAGANAIGAILGDGWYAGYVGYGRMREHYGGQPRVLAQLEVEYADGTKKTIVTDGSWKASYGEIEEADFLMGDTWDMNKSLGDWQSASYDDSKWNAPIVMDKWSGKLQGYPGVTVKKVMEIKAKAISQPRPGVYVFDMGQNFAGWVRLKAKGRAGDKLVLRFAEMLNPDGTIYTTNLRQARATDTVVLADSKPITWEPKFTFHGFRYVELTGCRKKPSLGAVTGVVVQSSTPRAGHFECSDSRINQLYSNIVWSQRGNFIDIPTDCPQRDERLGWTGDAQIFARTATYNMDVSAFFTKWLVDLDDAQLPDGRFPDVAPHKVATGSGVAAWGDAGVICPWTIYRVYDDKRIVAKDYEAMQKWIEWLKTNSKDLIRPDYGYGDWVSINSNTPKDVISTAFFAYSTRLLSKMALAINHPDDARKYEDLFQQIKVAFNKAFVSEDGTVKGNTQTCYLLALHFDLIAKDKRQAAVSHLLADLRERGWHLSTGFVGLSYLLPTLTENGHVDAAYRLLFQDTFPSWLYSIKNGATTIWERWDGWTKEKGFQDPGMNSFNHYSFGSVGRWMFGSVAGIDTIEPGYRHILIAPKPGGGLKYTKASYDSINGPIATSWKLDGKKLRLDVTIPANTTAEVHLPTANASGVTEGGKAISAGDHVRLKGSEKGEVVLSIDSGSYRFECEMK